jgi:RimJ/RimL family protein N-acetyltransferase
MKLKVLSVEDCEQIRLWRNQSLEMLRTPFPLTQEQQETFYRNIICNRQTNARFWGIWVDCGDLQSEEECLHFIGMCGLENISWENRLAETSLIFNPDYSMDKYGEEALQLLLYEGFMNMNLENIYTEVYECNPYHKFWIKQLNKYKGKLAILPNRKYHGGRYYDSAYINFTKEDFIEHENLISESAQTPN